MAAADGFRRSFLNFFHCDYDDHVSGTLILFFEDSLEPGDGGFIVVFRTNVGFLLEVDEGRQHYRDQVSVKAVGLFPKVRFGLGLRSISA